MLVDAAQIDPAASPDQTITPAPSPGIIRTRPHAILSDSETFFFRPLPMLHAPPCGQLVESRAPRATVLDHAVA